MSLAIGRPYYLTFGRLFFTYAYLLLESNLEVELSMKFVTDFGLASDLLV